MSKNFSKLIKIGIASIMLGALLISFIPKFDFLNKNKEKIVAKIDNVKITEPELQMLANNDIANFEQSSGKKITLTAEETETLKQHVLENIINEKLLEKMINQMDLVVSDNVVIEELKKVPIFIDENGLFNKEKFDNFLKEIGKSEKEYLRDMKEKMALYGVFNSFNKSYSNIALRTKLLLASFSKSRSVNLIELPDNNLSFNYNPSDENMLAYYNQNQDYYSLPEYRSISYIKFNSDNFKPEIKIDQSELDKRINNKLALSEGQEIRDFYNIICKNENDSKTIYNYIKDLGFENHIRKAENLEKIITKDLKLNNCMALKMSRKIRNNLPEEFQTIVFDKLKLDSENYLSQPLKTDMGSHVLLLLSNRNLNRQDIEEEIKNELMEEELNNFIAKTTEQIKNNIHKYKNLDEIVAEYKLTGAIEKTDLFDENGNIKNSPNSNLLIDHNFNDNLVADIFASPKDIIKIEQNNHEDYYLYKINLIEAPAIKKFEDVKNDIKAHAIAEFKIKKSKELLDKIIEELKSGKDLNEIKKIYKDLIYREDNIVNPMMDRLLQAEPNYPLEFTKNILSAQKGDIIGPVPYNNGQMIAIINEWKMNELDEESLDKLSKILDYDLYMNESNEIYQATLRHLKNKYKVINYLKKEEGK